MNVRAKTGFGFDFGSGREMLGRGGLGEGVLSRLLRCVRRVWCLLKVEEGGSSASNWLLGLRRARGNIRLCRSNAVLGVVLL